MPAIEVNNISMTFGGVKAVSNVNMKIEHGEIIGLIGPNGAGKTTFFNMLTGIYTPTEGEIIYSFDKKVYPNKIKAYEIASSGIARTFQNIRLFSDMTVEENATKKVMELLEIFNLHEKREELAKNLPYGDQRRLEIARALASNPKVLLLDEPAAGMNPNETNELMELIRWIRDRFDITVILIEHDMSLVMSVCNRIYVLDYGKLIANGTPVEIQNNPAVIKAYLGGDDEAC